MFDVKFTNSFKKDIETLKKRGTYNFDELFHVVDLLRKGNRLPEKYRDHQLKGSEYKGCRDCHIRGDWILIYRLKKQELILELMYTGTHSDLF
ncbi:MAG: type II toxin-antitoxin system YafQ family toxin [Sphaerochaetaceae bacterium]|nr:type II toxin-antitoxin system YafQ family toxin [Sphaerochaetaceae bacterium]